jgi:GT2 family glycosyltransferase
VRGKVLLECLARATCLNTFGSMDVSIIIVAWNVRELLGNCLRSVFRETHGLEYEVIYVDNGSVDGSVEMVRREFPQTRLLENKENRGFIKANNQGIEIAQGRYVLLLNSDTLVLDNAIAKTVAWADQHPEAAVVGCQVLNPDRTVQENCFRFYSTLNMLWDVLWLSRAFPKHPVFGRKSYGGWDFNSVREVDVVVGCFSLVRMAAIRQVGVMDERFFVYGDDIDWCYRFVKAGWKVFFAPVGQIIHYGGQTTKKEAGRFSLQLHGAVLINVKTHYNWLTFTVCRLLTAGYLLMRVPYWMLQAATRPKERRGLAWDSAKTCWLGGCYTLGDWTRLLMNRESVRDKV